MHLTVIFLIISLLFILACLELLILFLTKYISTPIVSVTVALLCDVTVHAQSSKKRSVVRAVSARV